MCMCMCMCVLCVCVCESHRNTELNMQVGREALKKKKIKGSDWSLASVFKVKRESEGEK